MDSNDKQNPSGSGKTIMNTVYDFLASYLPPMLVPTILELGVSDAEDTTKILSLCNSPKYYAFEPDPRNIAIIKNLPIYNKIHLVEKAVSNRNGKTTFYQSTSVVNGKEWKHSSSIKKPLEHLKRYPWCKFGRTIEVDTITLDTFCDANNISNVDFMWCDIQGAEGDMIAGAVSTLAKTKYLYTEYGIAELYEGEPTLPQLLALLPEWQLIQDFGAPLYNILLKNKKL